MKGRSQGDWRIDDTEEGLNITHEADDTVMQADHEAQRITFRLPRDPYRPVAVLKAFVKMGLSLMPQRDLRYFKDAIEWVTSPDHTNPLLSGHTVLMEFLPGPAHSTATAVALLRRIDDYLKLPFYFLQIAYGSQVFQVALPSPAKDWVLRGHVVGMPLFPHYTDETIANLGAPQTFALDLTGLDVVKGQVETVDFSYDDVRPVSRPIT